MSNVYYLQEYRIKKNIKEVEDALIVARKMVSKGVTIPEETFNRLENMQVVLEQELVDFIEKGEI
jgi:hypothetical protein